MALRRARSRAGSRPARRAAGSAGLALGVTLAIALGGCGPVETWRSLTGVDKNDPDPQSAPFTGNLAAGEAAPYPNLASVPPPPTRATTTAERQKLTQSLIADRNRAEADAGTAHPAAAVAAAKPALNAATPSPGAAAEAKALPAPNAATPSPSAAAEVKALSAPAPGAAAAPPAQAAAAAQAPSAEVASARGRTALNSTPSGRRKAGEPPEPSPQDSTLEMPQLRSVPEPEAARPAPPAPALGAVPRPATAEPLPASVANMVPEPAPPVPVLDPVAPPPSSAKPDPQTKPGAQRKPEPRRAPAATTVATLDIPGGGSATGAMPALQDRAQIERVAGLYRDNPGTVRVIAYAAGPAAGGAAGGDPLASYHAALERAQAVAKALTEAGIPASKIQTEASPAAGARTPGRVEIQFAQSPVAQ